jgi:hypothetical protein
MSFIPHGRTEWIQQARLATFVLAFFGYILLLMEGLSTGLGVYRNPTYCWIAGGFALLALAVASKSQKWIAIAALLIAIVCGVYGHYRNTSWREKLRKAQESAFSNSGPAASNQRASLDAAVAFCLHSGGHWRRASEPERSPLRK